MSERNNGLSPAEKGEMAARAGVRRAAADRAAGRGLHGLAAHLRSPERLVVASEAYAMRRAAIEEKIEYIQRRLVEHAEEQAADPKSWGFPGDLARVEELLSEAAQVLGARG